MALTDRYMLWSYLFIFTLVATGSPLPAYKGLAAAGLTSKTHSTLHLQGALAPHRRGPPPRARLHAAVTVWPAGFVVSVVNIRRRPGGRLKVVYPTIAVGRTDGWMTSTSSDAFSLSDNIESGDSRSGLDVAAKRQILQIMKRRNVNFDEARRIFIGQKFASNGIGADGRPTGILLSPSFPSLRSLTVLPL